MTRLRPSVGRWSCTGTGTTIAERSPATIPPNEAANRKNTTINSFAIMLERENTGGKPSRPRTPPETPPNQLGELLIQAAGQSGATRGHAHHRVLLRWPHLRQRHDHPHKYAQGRNHSRNRDGYKHPDCSRSCDAHANI
jgi:hypothetical protein